MLPHYRPDAINNEARREKTKRGTSPGEAPADTTASSSKIRIAYLGCVNERGLGVRRGVEKVAPLAREYKFIAKKSLRGGWHYGRSLRGFVPIVFKSGAHSKRCRGARWPRGDCTLHPALCLYYRTIANADTSLPSSRVWNLAALGEPTYTSVLT